MRSCSMALGLLSSALGSYMAGALTWVVQQYSEQLTGQQWLPNDLNLVSEREGCITHHPHHSSCHHVTLITTDHTKGAKAASRSQC